MAVDQVCSHLAAECLVDHVLHGYVPECEGLWQASAERCLLTLERKDNQSDMRQGVSTLLGDKRARS